jgi:hypothetical protein
VDTGFFYRIPHPAYSVDYDETLEAQIIGEPKPTVIYNLNVALFDENRQDQTGLSYEIINCGSDCPFELKLVGGVLAGNDPTLKVAHVVLTKFAPVNREVDVPLSLQVSKGVVNDLAKDGKDEITVVVSFKGFCSSPEASKCSPYTCVNNAAERVKATGKLWRCNCDVCAPGQDTYLSGEFCDGSPLPCASASGPNGPNGPDASKSSSSSMSGGIVAVIVVGVLFFIILVALVLLVFIKNKRKMDQSVLHLTSGGEHAVNAGFVPKQTTGGFEPGVANPMYDWYRPDMSRQESSDHLDPLAEGAFVVRDSAATPGWHMMVLKHENTILHEKIMMNNDGEYELLPSKTNRKQPAFETLPELVEFYKEERDESPYILCGGGVSNPIYDNHCLGASRKGEARPGYVLTDPNAPQLPLKRKDINQVTILSETGEDMYTNAADAKYAMNVRNQGSVAYREHSSTGTYVDTLKPEEEGSGYMAVNGI